MRSSGTDKARRSWRSTATLGCAALLLAAGTALAEAEVESIANDRDLEPRGEATLGANLNLIADPYDDDDLGGFFDQYLYTRHKGDLPPYFVDLMHLDFGLAREDDTYLFRIERFSPNQLNDRADLDVDWKGIGFDVDYWRFRTEELRYFPRGTYQDGTMDGSFFPTFGTQYTPDAPLDEVRTSNLRFFVKRTGLDGELRVRPEATGFTLPVLSEASVTSGYEERKGWRQDSFMLDSSEFPPTADAKFRGNRRRIDQNVTNVGGGFVLNPVDSLTADFDIDFESFREQANAVTAATLFPTNPAPARLTFDWVPDTDRLTARTLLGSKIGDLSLHGGAFVTHLQQTNTAPVRRPTDKHEVTTWSLQSGFDLPFAEQFSVAGYVKLAQRRNDMDRDDVAPSGFEPLLTQVAPILRRRTEVDGELEFAMRPQAGTLVATGYRFDWIKRNLRYGSGFGMIEPTSSLVEDDSNQHTLFLRSRTRLLRSVQVSGELGWDYQPEVSFPSDARYTVYFDGRGSYALPNPVPTTLSLFGGVSDAHGTGIAINGTSSSVRKDLDQVGWNYGATVTAVPSDKTTISTTFTQSRDEQDFPYARTQFPRTFGGLVIFEEPSRTHFASDVKNLVVSGTRQLTENVELSSFANVSFLRASFPNSSDLSDVLEDASGIRSRLLGVGSDIEWTASKGLSLGFGYRFDRYIDRESDEPITGDDERHMVTLTATVNLDFFAGLRD